MTPRGPPTIRSIWLAPRSRSTKLRERRWDRMNDFEKSTLLNFYISYYLAEEDFTNALRTFEEMFDHRRVARGHPAPDLSLVGSSYTPAEENWTESIENYQAWREMTLEEDVIVFKGLSYAHYQLDEIDPARGFLAGLHESLPDQRRRTRAATTTLISTACISRWRLSTKRWI